MDDPPKTRRGIPRAAKVQISIACVLLLLVLGQFIPVPLVIISPFAILAFAVVFTRSVRVKIVASLIAAAVMAGLVVLGNSMARLDQATYATGSEMRFYVKLFMYVCTGALLLYIVATCIQREKKND